MRGEKGERIQLLGTISRDVMRYCLIAIRIISLKFLS